jgi:hypothetical protein
MNNENGLFHTFLLCWCWSKNWFKIVAVLILLTEEFRRQNSE